MNGQHPTMIELPLISFDFEKKKRVEKRILPVNYF